MYLNQGRWLFVDGRWLLFRDEQSWANIDKYTHLKHVLESQGFQEEATMLSDITFRALYGDVIADESEWANQYSLNDHHNVGLGIHPAPGVHPHHALQPSPSFHPTWGGAQPAPSSLETLSDAAADQAYVPHGHLNESSLLSNFFSNRFGPDRPGTADFEYKPDNQYLHISRALGTQGEPDNLQGQLAIRPGSSLPLSPHLEEIASSSEGVNNDRVATLAGVPNNLHLHIKHEEESPAQKPTTPDYTIEKTVVPNSLSKLRSSKKSLPKDRPPAQVHRDQWRRGAKFKTQPPKKAPKPKVDSTRKHKHLDAKKRAEHQDFIVRCRAIGMTYKQIKEAGHLSEAESTLRGQYRNLIKGEEHRLRDPQ